MYERSRQYCELSDFISTITFWTQFYILTKSWVYHQLYRCRAYSQLLSPLKVNRSLSLRKGMHYLPVSLLSLCWMTAIAQWTAATTTPTVMSASFICKTFTDAIRNSSSRASSRFRCASDLLWKSPSFSSARLRSWELWNNGRDFDAKGVTLASSLKRSTRKYRFYCFGFTVCRIRAPPVVIFLSSKPTGPAHPTGIFYTSNVLTYRPHIWSSDKRWRRFVSMKKKGSISNQLSTM